VTGAATGIGRAIALRLAASGARVVVADVDERAGAATAAEADGLFVATDLRDLGAIDALARATEDAFGPAGILCNNAGIVRWQPLRDLTADTWDELVAINLRAVLFTTRAFLPQLEASGAGSVVNTASTSALAGASDLAAYSATKGGVVAATRALAVELAAQGIRVNAVCPGAIDTPIMDQALARAPGMTRDAFAASNLVGRNGMPADVAAAVVWLAGGEAAFVTGAVLVVDGGLTAAQGLNPSAGEPPYGPPGGSSGG
jgi:NAD(P)-dependent dehydrogenase (short-subunit alcohol dehydrogenase family)